jgi:glycosyltransferase involved in cell wall biosynthesis
MNNASHESDTTMRNHFVRPEGQRRLKIRHALPAFGAIPKNPDAEPMSGIVAGTIAMAQEQARLKHEVEVIGWNETGTSYRSRSSGVRLEAIKKWGKAKHGKYNFEWLLPVLARSIKNGPADILHIHSEWGLLHLPIASVRILHLRTPIPDPITPAHRRLLKKSDAVLCNSGYIRDRFLHGFEYPIDRTFVVYNGVNQQWFAGISRETARARLGLNQDDFIVLYAGAIVPEKGFQLLVDALRLLEAQRRPLLLVAGSLGLWRSSLGHAPEAIQYHENALRAAQAIQARFLGLVAHRDMPEVYAACDCFICPSIWNEPFGNVNIEAMSAGRPVIASRVGGIPETIADGHTGILVPPGDPRALAAAIARLGDDRELRTRMGHAARERAKRFSWEATATQLEGVYQALLAEKRTS